MMKLSKLMTLMFAAIMMISAGCSNVPKNNIVNSQRYIGQARGFWLLSEELQQGGEQEEIKTRLDEAIALATQQKLNSIFYEQSTNEIADFDPMTYLGEQTVDKGVQLFAVLGIAADPANDKEIKELASSIAKRIKGKPIAGVVLTNFEQLSKPEIVVRAVADAVAKANSTVALGVRFDPTGSNHQTYEAAVETLAAEGSIQMVLATVGYSMDGYQENLDRLTALKLGTADLYTVNGLEDRDTTTYQLLANAMNGKVTGAIFHSYNNLQRGTAAENEMLISFLAPAKSSYIPTDLTIAPQLAVSYPQSGLTVSDNEIWIMGSSDPAQPLTMNDVAVERPGSQGTFGVAAPLKVGDNSFTFAQGDTKTTVTVKRTSGTAAALPITKITAGSLFPTGSLGVDSNETFEVTVVGPATASITATLNGETVVMTQATAAKTKGVPVTFKGSFTMKPASFPADSVTNIGKVTYVVGYDGNHEVQKSEGEIYVAGKDVPLVVEVNGGRYVASVLTDVSNDDMFTQSLKSGARARVTSKTRTTRGGNPVIAYKLSNGGYVLASYVTIVTDNDKLYSDITSITKESGDDWEEYTLTGGQPAALVDWQEGKLVLRLLDSKLTADPSAMAGGLVTRATATETKDGVELTLEHLAGSLWGYDITYSDNTTKIYLRKPPKLSETYAKPLEGIRIMLDPGHGGTDPGAMGVAGELGPTEAILNMAYANAARFRLEQLGAEVLLTRVDESVRVTLDERNVLAAQEKPHFFIAMHHNSRVLNQDLSDANHIESYYWEQIAAPLAGHLVTEGGNTLGRDTVAPENAYYYVTRLTFTPAVLFELGFVINPAQYEDCTSFTTLCKAADGIGRAVVATLSQPPATPPADGATSVAAS